MTAHRHPGGEYQHLAPLFERLADPATPTTGKRQARAALVTGHLPIAQHIARRFAHRGQPVEDLEQVARMGLIYAVDRFDLDRERDFLAFAVPTITGEIRRYFRDQTWLVTMPRHLQELHSAITKAANDLAQEYGRAPRPRDIARRLEIPVEEVYEGLQAGMAYQADTLPDQVTDDDRPSRRQAALAEADRGLALVEDRDSLYRALARLPDRDATIVGLRFFGHLTQTQIARRVGVSQMQVSRILAASLERLRRTLTRPSPPMAGPRVFR